MPLYAEPQALEEIKVKFAYIFLPYHEGGGVPRLERVLLDAEHGGVTVRPSAEDDAEFVARSEAWAGRRASAEIGLLRPAVTRDGCRVMLGAIDPSNPTRGLMDHVLEWHVVHRDASDLERLFKSSKFGKAPQRVLKEAQGTALIAECVK